MATYVSPVLYWELEESINVFLSLVWIQLCAYALAVYHSHLHIIQSISQYVSSVPQHNMCDEGTVYCLYILVYFI